MDAIEKFLEIFLFLLPVSKKSCDLINPSNFVKNARTENVDGVGRFKNKTEK
jgi:hypothetical protein